MMVKLKTNRCPICRTPIERCLEFKLPKNASELSDTKNDSNDQQEGVVGSSSSQSTSALPSMNFLVDEGDKVKSPPFTADTEPTAKFKNLSPGIYEPPLKTKRHSTLPKFPRLGPLGKLIFKRKDV
jgi:hypothetical protein